MNALRDAEKGPCCLRFTHRTANLHAIQSLELPETYDSGWERQNRMALAVRIDRANGEKTI